jgi:hypothetical protein
MKFEAATAGPLSELEQADEMIRRVSGPARRLKNLIEGEGSWQSNQGFKQNHRAEHRG